MEVKKKYKQTDLGPIPTDWNLNLLRDVVVKVGSGITPTGGERVYKKEGRPFIRSQNVGWGKLLLNDVAFIDDEIHNTFSSTEICPDDVLLNITGASIGRSAVADDRVARGNVNQHVCIIRTNIKALYPHFLKYFLLSKNGQKQIDSFQSGGNRQGLNFEQIKNFQISLPPTLVEQTAIATALSDADRLITSIETLIDKKRKIMQGAMQELLKSQKTWEKKKLGEIAIVKARIGWQGLTTTEYRKSGEYVLITGTEFKCGHVNWADCYYVDENRYYQDKNIQIRENDVLVTKDGTIGKVAIIKSIPKPATLNSGVFVIRPKENSFDPHCFYYLLMSEVFTAFLTRLSAGSTINHLYQKDFVTFEFTLPKTIEEQQQISQILSDMDMEIEELENMLSKYKLIKQGMMQELLTGKIRLI